MRTSEPNSFEIGPVKFLRINEFCRLIVSKLEEDNSEKFKSKFNRRMMARSIRYYRKFQWIAEVNVKNASDIVAPQIAKLLASSALDCLHLQFGAYQSRHMRIGADAVGRGNSARILLSSEGKLLPSNTFGVQGHVGFPENWFEILSTEQCFSTHSQLIALPFNLIKQRQVVSRFLDAAHWFGEAARDQHLATKIVKLVNSMERLLIAEEPDKIAEILCKRISAMCKFGFYEDYENEFYERAKKAYTLRSKIVHGGISPSDDKIERGIRDCEDLVEKTLKSAILCFHSNGYFGKNVSRNDLESFLTNMAKDTAAIIK